VRYSHCNRVGIIRSAQEKKIKDKRKHTHTHIPRREKASGIHPEHSLSLLRSHLLYIYYCIIDPSRIMPGSTKFAFFFVAAFFHGNWTPNEKDGNSFLDPPLYCSSTTFVPSIRSCIMHTQTQTIDRHLKFTTSA